MWLWGINIGLWLGLLILYFLLDGMYTKNVLAIQKLMPTKTANTSAVQYLFGILGTYLCVKTSLWNLIPIVTGAWLGSYFTIKWEIKSLRKRKGDKKVKV